MAQSMPDGLSPDQTVFWQAFCQSTAAPSDADARFHSAFGIGAGSDAGAEEILSGRKTATSALPSEFLPGTPPIPGSLSLLYAGGGRPVAIVETVSITPLSLEEMDDDFIRAYSEWPDKAAFRAGMLDWYRQIDPGFSTATPLLAERFRVIWTGR
jgi:uncharacterized protein YhfF